jgi:PAS domain S-box-containing protein
MKAIIDPSPYELLRLELEKLKTDYQNFFEENPIPMLVAVDDTAKIIAANKAAQEKYGYSQDEMLHLTLENLSKNNSRLQQPDDLKWPTVHYKKCGEALYVETKKRDIVYKNVTAQLITISDITGKVLAGQKEKKARQRLEAIFKGTNDAILIANNEGQYVQVNEAACQMLGFAEAQLLCLSVKDLVVDLKPEDINLWDQFLDAGNQKGMIELKKKNGDIIICHYNATSNILPGLHLSIITDITERELSRREAERQAKYIDNIVERITDCFFAVDSNWIVQYWNNAAECLLQMPRSEVIGKNLWDVYKTEVGGRFYHEYAKAKQSNLPVHFEEYYSGGNIWLDVSAYPARDGVTVYFRDITEKRKLALDMLQTKNNEAALINSTSDLIWSIDKKEKLVSFNSAYKKWILKATGKQAFVGLQLPVTIHHGKKSERWKSLYQRALRGESFSVDETILDLKTGDEKIAEVSFNPIYAVNSNNVVGVACHLHNITERVKNQLLIEEQNRKLQSNKEDLQKLTKKLEKIMNSSLDIICAVDTDCRFVQVSNASSDVLGYKPEELVGRVILDFVDPEYLQVTINAGKELAEGKDLISFQNVYIHKNGRRVTLNWSARKDVEEGLIFAVARDTTLHVEAEKLRAVAEQRFTALVQKSADMIGILDREGNYKYTSPNIESVLGYTAECLYNNNALLMIHPDDLLAAQTEFEKVIAGGDVKIAACRYRHVNGEWRWFETKATNQLDNPAINGIVINSRDITHRKKIEAERELMIEELLRSNADLKQFSFITSHNLRAPLSNITGLLNIIDYSTLDSYNKQMIDMLDISSRQLQQTIDDLSKILVIKNNVNVEISSIDLEEVINDVKKSFINTLNDVCADIVTDFKVRTIDFNRTYLQSILVNLVSNSIKYQSPRRSLLITVSSQTDEKGNVIFKFADNGSGIDLGRHKEKVFGLYQRFHDSLEGHGLGLFIIKSQIVALGGSIDVESELEGGTTFIITFKNQAVGFNEDGGDEISARSSKPTQASFDL